MKHAEAIKVLQDHIRMLDQMSTPTRNVITESYAKENIALAVKMHAAIDALTAAQQAQPERAPLSEAELEQEFCKITGLETGINPAAADTKRALVWFKKGYAHGIKQGGQHE